MSSGTGHFVWYELLTSDPAAAADFCTKVVGWTCADAGMPGGQYSLFSVGQSRLAGLMIMPPQAAAAGAQIGWRGLIAVDDVDAYAERVKSAGGALYHGPEDIPTVGRIAVVADPQGAPFTLFAPTPVSENPRLAPGTQGTVGWHELHAADGEAASAFYTGLFGWTIVENMDMGAHGLYRIFSTGGAAPDGATLTRFDASVHPNWLYYVNVDDIQAAQARVKDAGGTVTVPPQQVPGGGWIIQGKDPQGAAFALFSPPK
jgi:predicted enzyme related to lactoylglutathione lyase